MSIKKTNFMQFSQNEEFISQNEGKLLTILSLRDRIFSHNERIRKGD